MKCPNCNETLLITQRNNVEIDYCPNCRGVWLDRGELDKIVDYVERMNDGNQSPSNVPYQNNERKYYPKHEEDQYRKRKRKGLLGDFFDFD